MKQRRINRKRSLGFGLVEILVAVLIGMFGVLIMMQVLATSEEQKRTTTSGNDALNEGLLALYALQSDVQSAGNGATDSLLLGCNLTLRTVPSALTIPLAPVIINTPGTATFPMPAPDLNTDTLFVFASRGAGSPQGDKVVGAANQIQNPPAYQVNDLVVWVRMDNSSNPPKRVEPCNLTLDRVTAVDPGARTLTLASGAIMAQGDYIFNFGPSYRALGYAVRNGNLTMCDYSNPARACDQLQNWVAINNNIVSLRAQYGRDINPTPLSAAPPLKPAVNPVGMDGVIDVYDTVFDSTLDPLNPSTNKFYCQWVRISAVRVALTSRSAVMEACPVTGVNAAPSARCPDPAAAQAPEWEGSYANVPTGSAASPIDLTADPNWTFYRYRVFQSVLPIRNISWLGKVSSC